MNLTCSICKKETTTGKIVKGEIQCDQCRKKAKDAGDPVVTFYKVSSDKGWQIEESTFRETGEYFIRTSPITRWWQDPKTRKKYESNLGYRTRDAAVAEEWARCCRNVSSAQDELKRATKHKDSFTKWATAQGFALAEKEPQE